MPSTEANDREVTVAATATAADRFMRRLLRVSSPDKRSVRGAQRAFRVSLVITAIRCLITYLAVPILIPISAIAGLLAAPISISLCLFAFVSGVISVRRFWAANHRNRWMYTGFMAVVFAVLTVALMGDVGRLAVTM